MKQRTASAAPPGRPISSLALLLLVPLVVGLLAGPWVYNPIRSYLRSHGTRVIPEKFSFEKVTQRCIMATALFMLVPMFRRSGLSRRIRDALRLDPSHRRQLAASAAIGCVSMGALYLGGFAIGAYAPESYLRAGPALLKCGQFLLGALFIGFFEECLFRGFVFGALRARMSFWLAAIASSAFFSILHYMKPDAPFHIKVAKWDQGLRLLPYTFATLQWSADWSAILTLFIMVLALCVLYERRRHLAWCIGLHGGWVLAMQLGNYFLGRERDYLTWWFSRSDYIVNAPIAIPIILGFFLWSLTLPPTAESSTPPPSIA